MLSRREAIQAASAATRAAILADIGWPAQPPPSQEQLPERLSRHTISATHNHCLSKIGMRPRARSLTRDADPHLAGPNRSRSASPTSHRRPPAYRLHNSFWVNNPLNTPQPPELSAASSEDSYSDYDTTISYPLSPQLSSNSSSDSEANYRPLPSDDPIHAETAAG